MQHQLTPRHSNTVSMPMDPQLHVAFLQHVPIFATLGKHLTPEAIIALACTSQLARNEVKRLMKDTLHDPVRILHLLGKCSRVVAAGFFRQFRSRLEKQVKVWQDLNPDNFAAHALNLMMCEVRRDTIDQAHLTTTRQYLILNHYPPRIIQCLSFIHDFLYDNDKNLFSLLNPQFGDFYINLHGADLGDAILNDADLTGADLRDACLMSGKFVRATLIDADLKGAEVTLADFSYSNLNGANLANIREELGIDLLPSFSHASFFRKSPDCRQVDSTINTIKKQVRQIHGMTHTHQFLSNAIVEDYLKTVGSRSDYDTDTRISMLEYALQQPAFTQHSSYLINFFSDNILHVATHAEEKLQEELRLVIHHHSRR